MKINWTPESITTFEQIIENIYTYWTQKEVIIFIEQAEKTIEQIRANPYMFVTSNKKMQVRKGFGNRIISIFYKVYIPNNKIDILAFWNNRKNPNENPFN